MSATGKRRRPALRFRRLQAWLLALVVVIVDQASKLWAMDHLASGVVQPFLPGLLQLRRVANTGAAFSLLSGNTALLGLVSALAALGVTAWLVLRPPTGLWLSLGAGFLLGGTLGNGLDRWRLGWVVDFLEFVPIHFPIFNLADVAINLAVLCFLIDLLRPQAASDA
ncbi:signal peptidase II [Cyanobium sp. FGCU-52]|nr:signal peptidase II [Cyanobium sp. FGCU52]